MNLWEAFRFGLVEQRRFNSFSRYDEARISPLMHAAGHGRLRRLKYLTGHRRFIASQLEDRDVHGRTALMHAVSQGHFDCTLYLLDMNVRLEARDKNGFTAVMWATFKNQHSCVGLLIDRHANLNNLDGKGRTACMYAASRNYPNVLWLLIHNGARLDIHDRYKSSAFSVAVGDCRGIVAQNICDEAVDHAN
jgi:ankyrin repeat protein